MTQIMTLAVVFCAMAWLWCGLAQAQGQAGPFTDHGVPAPVSRARGVAAALDGDGKPVVLIWLSDHRGSRTLGVVDALTGETKQYDTPFANNNSPFAILMSSDGIFYTQFGTGFVGFDSRRREFTVHEKTIDGLAMSFTEDAEGIIWTCLYPDSNLVRYDPKSGAISWVQLHKENWRQYARSIACDDAGWIYAGIGNTASHIVGYHHASGQIKPMIPDEDRKPGTGHVYRGVDGKVYGSAVGSAGPWYELVAGAATPIEKPSVAAVRILNGSQETVLRDFPDGRRIAELDVPERWMTILDSEGAAPRRVAFDYESEGSHILSMIQTADGRMHGSTGHPLRVYSFDPRDGAIEHRGLLDLNGHLNALAIQRGLVYGASYGARGLWEIDFSKPWADQAKENPNPVRRLGTEPQIGRPHACLAHPDGRRVIVGGTPGYGMTGGGLAIYDVEMKSGEVLTHEQVMPDHSTFALAALSDGLIVGGTTIAAGTGGPSKAAEAELYLFDLVERKVVFRQAVIPGANEIRDLIAGPDDRIYGFTGDATFFVFDSRSRQVIHQEDLSSYGRLAGVQGPRVMTYDPDGKLIVLYRAAVVRIDPASFTHERLTTLPVSAGAGPVIHDGRLYFTSDSHIWSWQMP